MPKIYLLDVTNRDGVQTAKLGLSKDELLFIVKYPGIAKKLLTLKPLE